MTPSNPVFSVVIPTFNRADLLPRAIASVLAQTDGDFEIVVVDDGSTDATETVVRGIADPRVTYRAQANAGVCAARNAGAAAATGHRLLFLDSDDELLPHALATFRSAADANGWSVVLSGWNRVSSDGRERRALTPQRSGPAPQLVGPYLAGAFVIERAVFDAAGGYDEALRYSENTALSWCVRRVIAATGAGIGTIDDALVVHHERADRSLARARYDAAVHILDRYAGALADPVTGAATPRHRRANYLGIAGASAAELGLRREAWHYSFAALRNEPTTFARYKSLAAIARATVVRRDQPA